MRQNVLYGRGLDDLDAPHFTGDVVAVLLRDDELAHPGLACAVDLLRDASDLLDLPLDRDLTGHGDVLAERLLLDSAEHRQYHRQPRAGPIDQPAADHVHVHVVVGRVAAGNFADDRRRIEDGIFGHRPRGLIEPDRAAPALAHGEGGGLDLDEGADVLRDAEGEDLADLGDVRRLRGDAGGEPAAADDLEQIVPRDAGMPAPSPAVDSDPVGIGEHVHTLAPFDRVLADEGGDAALQIHAQAPPGLPHDLLDVLLREWVEENLRA